MSRRRNSEPTASTSNRANISAANNVGCHGYFDESEASRNYPGFLASLFDHAPRSYGEALLRWQEEQISACITENHVNQTVELYMQFSNTNQPASSISFDSEFDTVQQTAVEWAMANYGLYLPRMPTIDTDQDGDRAIESPATNEPMRSTTIEEEETMESNGIAENQQHQFNPNEHHDFMDLAVAAAIQEKGLVVTQKSSNP